LRVSGRLPLVALYHLAQQFASPPLGTVGDDRFDRSSLRILKQFSGI